MRAVILPIVVLVAVAGCATQKPAAPDTAPAKAAPQPRYNLTGYSPAFKAGYTDACATPRRRSEARFKSDDDYRMGWQDGASMCKTAK